MSKLRVHAFTISLDGYGAGPNQDLQNPLGVGGGGLHEWFIPTRTFRKYFGQDGGETGADDDFAARGVENLGAWILGRNMFGPVRGAWPDDTWKGWWGDNPPYHVPVFVLTHHARAPVTMEGGTTFHFVTDGIDAALKRAREAANGKRRARWRWRGDDPAIPAGTAGRRDACRDLAGAARQRRGAVRRARSAGARLRADGARADREGDACGADEAGVKPLIGSSSCRVHRPAPSPHWGEGWGEGE